MCTGLQAAGFTVAAIYVGSDDRAADFTARTGIKAWKFNVADHQAVLDGVAAIEAELGPIDVAVNNAGITRDGLAMRMKDEDWDAVLHTNLDGFYNVLNPLIMPMVRRRKPGRIVTGPGEVRSGLQLRHALTDEKGYLYLRYVRERTPRGDEAP